MHREDQIPLVTRQSATHHQLAFARELLGQQVNLEPF